jgi:hypothetical protein
MPEQPKFTALTLRSYSEALRRELYDAVVQHLWTPDDHGDYVPPYTPDACGLVVSYDHGRWLVTYTDLEEPADAPPDQRAVMSRVLADPDRRFGVTLSEV